MSCAEQPARRLESACGRHARKHRPPRGDLRGPARRRGGVGGGRLDTGFFGRESGENREDL